MKKNYSAPVVEKVTFDYTVQTSQSTSCTGSVMNIATTLDQCGEGTPTYWGWTSEHPGGF